MRFLACSRLGLLIELHALLLVTHFAARVGARRALSDDLHACSAEFARAHSSIRLLVITSSYLTLESILLVGAPVASAVERRLLSRRLLESLVRRVRLIRMALSSQLLGRLPVSVEHDEIIILWHVLFETIVFSEERNELIARSIVGQLLGAQALASQHIFKKCFTISSALHRLVNVKIEHADWLDFLDGTVVVPYEQVALASFQNTYGRLALGLHIQLVV